MTPRRTGRGFAAGVLVLIAIGCTNGQISMPPPGPAPTAGAGEAGMGGTGARPAESGSGPGATGGAAGAGEERDAGGEASVAMLPPPPLVDTRPVVSASVSGYQLLVRRRDPAGTVTAAPYDIRGIAWSPGERGGQMPGPAAFNHAMARDLPLMREAHVNTVRTYAAPDRAVLDECLRNGILAIVTVVTRGTDDYAGRVTALRDHPAVLMWLVGNEWNRNDLFGSCAGDACYGRVDAIARDIKRLDPNHPVATSFAPVGDLPLESDLQRLASIDVWGLNVYSQPGFFNRFLNWRFLAERTGIKRPFFMSEYGADAYDNRAQRPDEAAQADVLARQTQEIRFQLSARNPAFPCLGGTPFEWSDEWWKYGSPQSQDAGGFANMGVAIDGFANEDWWGIVDIDRKPRQAYTALQKQYAR